MRNFEKWPTREEEEEDKLKHYLDDFHHCPFCRSGNLTISNHHKYAGEEGADDMSYVGISSICHTCHNEWFVMYEATEVHAI